jgi:hypothetical protein
MSGSGASIDASPSWSAEARKWLDATMDKRGDTQEDVARLLLEEYGAPKRPTQETVCRWVSGQTKRPSSEFLGPIRAYCEDHAPELRGAGYPASADQEQETGENGEDEAAFAHLVRTITDEPLLGERQGRLIDGLAQRLATGPSLTVEDLVLAKSLAGILNIDLKMQQGPSG